MAPRPPLTVQTVTKIPVQTGLNITNPATTGAITRTVGAQTVQNAGSRATVEVVQNVPNILKNITPVSLGQKLASFGQGAVNLGTKVASTVGGAVSGASGLAVGAATAGILAIDAALFARPAGLGSDRVGGVKIGSQPKSSPTTAPIVSTGITTQPIAKPQAKTQPKPQAKTQPKPQAQTPFQPISKPQIQTRPQSQLGTSQTQLAPIPFQPRPLTVNLPQPRATLQTPSVERPAPISPASPYPLNLVDLNSYGGVNLNYPIAQKLIEFDYRFDEIERKLQEIPQGFQETLQNTKIETIITLPAKIDLTSQLPLQLNVGSQLPVTTNLSSQIPVTTNLSSQIPVTTNLSSQLPATINLTKAAPVNIDFSSQLPLNLDLASQLPLNVGFVSQLPARINLSKEVPVTSIATAQFPLNIDLTKKIPVALDISTILRPDEKASGIQDLQKCCEAIQATLKKKAEMFEGSGNLVCGDGTVPYSYRGEGLNGIHQAIKISLGANAQILQKICDLESNIEYPLIEGSGIYECGTQPVNYNYSGRGFLGIQNQIDQLFNLDKNILVEVCEINSSPFGSLPFPDISGELQYFDCDGQTQAILYSGNGLEGLSQQVDALTVVVKTGIKAACNSASTVIMPDARYEQFKPIGQLAITLGTKYPTQAGSLWHIYLPNPKDNLNWCDHFDRILIMKGNVYARLEWENSKLPTGLYFQTEEEAIRVLRYIATLSNASPTLNELGEPKIFIGKGNSVKRDIPERALRAVRAVASTFGLNGEVANLKCYTPPPEGCSPTII